MGNEDTKYCLVPKVSRFWALTALMGCNCPEEPHLGPPPTLLFGLGALYSLSLALYLSCVVSRSALSFNASVWASWPDLRLDLWLLDDCCAGLAQVLWGCAYSWWQRGPAVPILSWFSSWSSLHLLLPENLKKSRGPGRCLCSCLRNLPKMLQFLFLQHKYFSRHYWKQHWYFFGFP